MDDTESSSIDADATSIGKKRARLDNKAVVNTRSVKVLLNRCAYVPPRTALLCKRLRPAPPQSLEGEPHVICTLTMKPSPIIQKIP